MVRRYGSASQLIDELGISEPDDIDVEAIAQYCAATIVYHPLNGCEARILGNPDRAIITINSNASLPRQRFSAGHELGHWMRDRGKIAFACTEQTFYQEWQVSSAESRANEFSAELLMPEKILSRYARSKSITFATASELSGLFRTSLTATAIRLVQAGPLPAMIICSEKGFRKWFIRGPDVPESIWPRESPTAYTVAADLIKRKQVTSPNEIRADAWIDRRGARNYFLIEDSKWISATAILTLLWWKNERQLIDVTEEEESRESR